MSHTEYMREYRRRTADRQAELRRAEWQALKELRRVHPREYRRYYRAALAAEPGGLRPPGRPAIAAG